MDAHSPDAQVTFIVQVKDQSQTDRIVTALRDKGLRIDRILKTVGVVGGTGPRTLRKAITGVPGVGLVREEAPAFQTPPFDERIPQ